MGKEKKTFTEQQPLLYIAQPIRSQPVGRMQKVFIVKQNSIEQYQLDLDKEDKSESLPNVPSSEVENEEIEIQVEEKPFSVEEESVSVDNETEIEKDVGKKKVFTQMTNVPSSEVESEGIETQVEEKPFSVEEESVSADNEAEIEKDVGKKKVFTQMTNVEKINYVLNRPHYIPNIQCAVQTKKEVYVGYIVSFEKKVLKMKNSTHFGFVTIALADIETIQMKGLA
ncbi:CotO family spore coat protein [Bacillus sp. DX4.1]|uniref:CotO family spore coat protein n=1 Tax=Bacillus sp. DX4.1 TaxID=3055867 RepID=UPI0025A255F7|nr:CotO family spore coat protein [Bacillus sp. DX4.1]MDM5187514.1 CotO family spore coat protein [Bacillus sp. DX4.1]